MREVVLGRGWRPAGLVFAIPRHQVLIRTMRIPPGDAEEVERMIRFQAERDLPIPADRIRVAHRRIDDEDGSVLVAATSRDLIAELSTMAQAAEMPLRGAVVGLLALVGQLPKEPAAVAVLDVGGRTTEVAIRGGASGRLFSRSVPVGTSGGVHGGTWQDSLADEVRRSLRAYLLEKGACAPEKVYVYGIGARDDTAVRKLAEAAGVPVEVGTVSADMEDGALAWAAAIAILERPSACLDLKSEPVVRRRRWAVGLGSRWIVGAAVVLLGLGIVLQYMLSLRRGDLTTIRSDLSRKEPRVQRVRALHDRLADARQWGDLRPSWIEVLRELTEIFPEGVVAGALEVSDSGTLRVQGSARSDQDVHRLLRDLNASTCFGKTTLGYIRKREGKGGHPYEYSVEARILRTGGAP